MALKLKLVVPPEIEPVTLQEANAHIVEENQDSLIRVSELIVAAREYCERFQERQYITATWELWLDSWPSREYISIPRPPLQTVLSVKYFGSDGKEHVMKETDYITDPISEPGRIVLNHNKSWPSCALRPVNGIAIRFVAGYGDSPSDVPRVARQAILMLIGHWHDNREATTIGVVAREMPFSVNSLLWPERVMPV